MRVRRLDANDAIIAQLLRLGCIPGPDLELPGWTEEVLG